MNKEELINELEKLHQFHLDMAKEYDLIGNALKREDELLRAVEVSTIITLIKQENYDEFDNILNNRLHYLKKYQL